MSDWQNPSLAVADRFNLATETYRTQLVEHGLSATAAAEAAAEFRSRMRIEADGRLAFIEQFSQQPIPPSVTMETLTYGRFRTAAPYELHVPGLVEPTPEEEAAARARSERGVRARTGGSF